MFLRKKGSTKRCYKGVLKGKKIVYLSCIVRLLSVFIFLNRQPICYGLLGFCYGSAMDREETPRDAKNLLLLAEIMNGFTYSGRCYAIKKSSSVPLLSASNRL